MGWQDRDYHREDTGGLGGMRIVFPPFTPLFLALAGINLFLFLLKVSDQAYDWMREWGALSFVGWDYSIQLWRWVSYQYIHADGGHVFFNMLSLYFFLPILEKRWGWMRTLVFYTLGGITAGFCYLILVSLTGYWGTFLIGASGAVLSIIGAVAYLYPDIRIFGIIPIRVMAGLLGVLYLLTIVGDRNFSSAAHLGGLGFGFLAPWLLGPVLAERLRWYRSFMRERALQAEIAEQKEVDRILAKVADQGMHSLSAKEKRILNRATQNQRRRDEARQKRLQTPW